MQQKIKILIACHRQYPVPAEPCYLPVEVGAALHPQPIPGFTPDNTGENISEKNTHYCELTALYWGWKNLDAACIGLVHYRRFFGAGRPLRIADRADFEKERFYSEVAKGLEKEPERGARCMKCYDLRLRETAKRVFVPLTVGSLLQMR